MDPELKYTRISISQLKEVHPQLMPVIVEEPHHNASKRESIALHPICECNCCCYFCCGCPELYTPLEMAEYAGRMTLCPITSIVVNNSFLKAETANNCTKYSCVLSPVTMVADLVSLFPRCIIACVRK